MNTAILFALAGVGLFSLGLHGLIVHAHLLRKILAINIMGSGTFLVLVSMAKRVPGDLVDPVPHAMVITGIVVAVSATALALGLMLKVRAFTGAAKLDDTDGPW